MCLIPGPLSSPGLDKRCKPELPFRNLNVPVVISHGYADLCIDVAHLLTVVYPVDMLLVKYERPYCLRAESASHESEPEVVLRRANPDPEPQFQAPMCEVPGHDPVPVRVRSSSERRERAVSSRSFVYGQPLRSLASFWTRRRRRLVFEVRPSPLRLSKHSKANIESPEIRPCACSACGRFVYVHGVLKVCL